LGRAREGQERSRRIEEEREAKKKKKAGDGDSEQSISLFREKRKRHQKRPSPTRARVLPLPTPLHPSSPRQPVPHRSPTPLGSEETAPPSTFQMASNAAIEGVAGAAAGMVALVATYPLMTVRSFHCAFGHLQGAFL